MGTYINNNWGLRREAFITWLQNVRKMTMGSAKTTFSWVNRADEYVKEISSGEKSFLEEGDKKIAVETIKRLFQDEYFLQKNIQSKNRYFSALNKYLEFLGERPVPISTTVDISIPSNEQEVEDRRQQEFEYWMRNALGMTQRSARAYFIWIRQVDRFARENHIGVGFLLSDEDNKSSALTIQEISNSPKFQNIEHKIRNRYVTVMKKYLSYLEIPGDEFSYAHLSKTKYIDGNSATSLLLDEQVCKQIMKDQFPSGIRPDSYIDLKKFITAYNNQTGDSLDVSDGDVRKRVGKEIQKFGIMHGAHLYSIDSVADEKTKTLIDKYIQDAFRDGNSVIYFNVMFKDLLDILDGQRIYDADMLQIYVSTVFADKYHFTKAYMSRQAGMEVDAAEEVKEYLINCGEPKFIEEISEALDQIPIRKIEGILQSHQEYIRNARKQYTYFTLFDFNQAELLKIRKVIDIDLENTGFISGNELLRDIRTRYPEVIERFTAFSDLGIRNAIAYFLRDDYSFENNLISNKSSPLTMGEAFANFASSRDEFTLDELLLFANDMGSVVYFNHVYDHCLRVSEDRFVSRDRANFDIEATDRAINHACNEEYFPIKKIRNFDFFPECAFSWNEYLLEHYVAAYSKEYKLIHLNYNQRKCVGGIVKRHLNINDYQTLFATVIADAKIDLKADIALEYLKNQGYIAKKALKDADCNAIIAEAKRIRNS